MPWPVDLTTKTITSSYPNNASGLSGWCSFTPTADLADSTGLAILRAAPMQVQVTAGVMAPIVLPCTDNADLTPSGWAWTVIENLQGAPTRIWSFNLPHTLPSTVDLSALTPLVTPPTLVQYLLATNNLSDVQNPATARTNLGVVPAAVGVEGLVTPPGGTTEFLRADGGWAVPAGGGGGSAYSRQIEIAADGLGSSVVAPVGTWTPTYLMTSDTGGVWSGWVNVSDAAQNDALSFDFACDAGTYTVELLHLPYTNRGTYTIEVDGVSVGTIDGYAAALAATRSRLPGIVISAGAHYITLLMATKNASSSGYVALVERLVLTRTA